MQVYLFLSDYRKTAAEVAGKRVIMFSYGSGLASTMYSFRISADSAPTSDLSKLMQTVSGLSDRLKSRKTVAPSEFESIMSLREKVNHTTPYTPAGSVSDLFPGTYYLTSVDEKHRRQYDRVPPTSTTPLHTLTPCINGTL